MRNVKNPTAQIRLIQGELMQTLKELKEKIAALEAEKAKLLAEVYELRKAAEAKIASLEDEVGQIRAEAKSLRDLVAEPAPAAAPAVQILPATN
jgi:predicted  nucleic acid-binding Zn-ribbon protein